MQNMVREGSRRSGTTLAVTTVALAGIGTALWVALAAVFNGWQATALVAASAALVVGTLGSVWAMGRLGRQPLARSIEAPLRDRDSRVLAAVPPIRFR